VDYERFMCHGAFLRCLTFILRQRLLDLMTKRFPSGIGQLQHA
jgi:hypothetical protein